MTENKCIFTIATHLDIERERERESSEKLWQLIRVKVFTAAVVFSASRMP